ncbi:hypothetical protein EVAR_54783_1 [Eumeta japonica]|uniref:Uncharacterized protein n=1 Tax=Eumeta variegata TaxID=151549 RepID=A0A4C1YF46_EUMVA|nr:hypothetical protein EVAR_54783_1 [Eumeta japonica]
MSTSISPHLERSVALSQTPKINAPLDQKSAAAEPDHLSRTESGIDLALSAAGPELRRKVIGTGGDVSIGNSLSENWVLNQQRCEPLFMNTFLSISLVRDGVPYKLIDERKTAGAARGRPIIVEWESAFGGPLSFVRPFPVRPTASPYAQLVMRHVRKLPARRALFENIGRFCRRFAFYERFILNLAVGGAVTARAPIENVSGRRCARTRPVFAGIPIDGACCAHVVSSCMPSGFGVYLAGAEPRAPDWMTVLVLNCARAALARRQNFHRDETRVGMSKKEE